MNERDAIMRDYLDAYRKEITPDARSRMETWQTVDATIAREPAKTRRRLIVPVVTVLALAAALVLVMIARPTALEVDEDEAPSVSPYSSPKQAPEGAAGAGVGTGAGESSGREELGSNDDAAVPEEPGPNDDAAVRQEPGPNGDAAAAIEEPERPGEDGAFAVPKPAPRRDKRSTRRGSPTEAPAGDAGSLADELALLGPAQAALQAGRPAKALALFERHAARFPDSALAEERAAGRVLALCALGRDDAAAGHRAFQRRYPGSPLQARLTGACADRDDR